MVSLTVVGPRPLPFDERSQSVVLVDTSASARFGEVEIGVTVRNLLNRTWRDGEFVYISNFHQEATAPSLVPARHMTAGYPLEASAYVALHL
jgi:outer membrane receptor protein involved in Fe transport